MTVLLLLLACATHAPVTSDTDWLRVPGLALVPVHDVTHVVGAAAMEDCRRAMSLGWQACSVEIGPCVSVSITSEPHAQVIFRPTLCEPDETKLHQWHWMFSADRTKKVAIVPLRSAGEPAPEIHVPPEN